MLAEAHDRDFAHVLAIAPRPYASRWKDLEPHVVAKGWRRSHLIDPEPSPVRPERRGRAAAPESKGSAVVKPVAMTLREVDDAIIDCDRECYFESGKQLLAVKAGVRKDNVYRSMKLIKQSSFVEKIDAGKGDAGRRFATSSPAWGNRAGLREMTQWVTSLT